MELVEPKCNIEVVVLEESHDLLKILKVLTVNVDVLVDDLAPFAQLLSRFLTIRKGILSITLGLRFKVGEAVYTQKTILLCLFVAVG